jgi:hypothetical protein
MAIINVSGIETLDFPETEKVKEEISLTLDLVFKTDDIGTFIRNEILDRLLWAITGNSQEAINQYNWNIDNGFNFKDQLRHEHIVPRNVIRRIIMRSITKDYGIFLDIFKIYGHAFVITADEDENVKPKGEMIKEWEDRQGCDIFARYRETGIHILEVDWRNNYRKRQIAPNMIQSLICFQ